jgi:hypothetical protein
VSEPTRPPRGFIVSAAGRFTGDGIQRFERGVRLLLWNLARNSEVGGAVIAKISSFAPQRHVHVAPDSSPCGEWKRNAHAQPLQVGGIDLGARVLYTPKCWQFAGVWDARVVLFHELIHAFRHLTGSRSGAAGPRAYPNAEEFHATTLANVLRSELRLPLRMGYTFADPVFGDLVARVRGSAQAPEPPPSPPGGLQTRTGQGPPSFGVETLPGRSPTRRDLREFSAHFAAQHPAVARLFGEMPTLAGEIARVAWSTAPFNPYRAFREVSTARAKLLDKLVPTRSLIQR